MTGFRRTTRALEPYLVAACLLVLAFRFYPGIFRFLDDDEIFAFNASHQLASGARIYADAHFYYPPLTWYLPALLFHVLDPYRVMLTCRIVIVTIGLAAFATVFRMLRLGGSGWYALPLTIAACYVSAFHYKLTEYRSDNVLSLIVTLQGYLTWRLVRDEAHSDRRVAWILLLVIVGLHVNQKAVFLQLPLLAAFLATPAAVSRFWPRYRRRVLLAFFLLAGLPLLSEYRAFVHYAYFDGPNLITLMSRKGGPGFLLAHARQNSGFWLLSFLCSMLLLSRARARPCVALPPLALLVGAILLVAAAHFPFLQYQQFVAWAALLAMPPALELARSDFGVSDAVLYPVFLAAALTSLATASLYGFPYHPPLRQYASTIERVDKLAGPEPVAALNGAAILRAGEWPLTDYNLVLKYREGWTIRRALVKSHTQLIFDPDPYDFIRKEASGEDRWFVGLNYRPCLHEPVMVPARWLWLQAGDNPFSLEIDGPYRLWHTTGGSGSVLLDGQTIAPGVPLVVERGAHVLSSPSPGAVLMEGVTRVDRVPCSARIGWSDVNVVPIGDDFGGVLTLEGILRSRSGNTDLYTMFWRKTGPVDKDLGMFHHFVGPDDTGVVNVVPGERQYSLRDLPAGEAFSYDFGTDPTWRTRDLRIGVFSVQDMASRLKHGDQTFLTLPVDRSH